MKQGGLCGGRRCLGLKLRSCRLPDTNRVREEVVSGQHTAAAWGHQGRLGRDRCPNLTMPEGRVRRVKVPARERGKGGGSKGERKKSRRFSPLLHLQMTEDTVSTRSLECCQRGSAPFLTWNFGPRTDRHCGDEIKVQTRVSHAQRCHPHGQPPHRPAGVWAQRQARTAQPWPWRPWSLPREAGSEGGCELTGHSAEWPSLL